MNSRERVRVALQGGVPDRIPLALAFFPQSVPGIGDAQPEEYFDLDVRFAEFSPPPEQASFLHYLERLPPDVHVGDLRQLRTYHEWDYHPELGPEGALGPATTVEELSHHTFPDLADPLRYRDVARQVAAWHDQGLAVAGAPPHLGGELFETAWRLRGFETFMGDLAQRPQLAHYLLDQITALSIHGALVLARAGIDILLLDDDVAMPGGLMISLATWQTFFKPRLAHIIHLAREAAPDIIIFYHSDGNFTDLLRDLVEIGVQVIHPLQPDCMDARAIRREFGPTLAFWGTVGTAALLDRGTPADVRAEVQRRIREVGPASLLLAPAYDTDFMPLPNLVAFYEAAREYAIMPP